MKYLALIAFVFLLIIFTIGLYKLFTLHKKSSQAWLNYATKTTADKKSGVFTAIDKTGATIYLEWRIINTRSHEFLATTKELSDFMVQNWTPIEVDYLKAYPEDVMEKEHLQAFRPLFAQGIEHVDWQKVSALMGTMIKGFVEADPKDFFGEHDISIFVIAKDKATNTRLGFIQYLVKQEYPYGTINLGNLAVDQTARNRGLGKILTSSIYKLLTKTERIFLYTRTTNVVAQKAYMAYGFKVSKKPITDPIFAHGWFMMEYKTDESDIMQKEAIKLFLVN